MPILPFTSRRGSSFLLGIHIGIEGYYHQKSAGLFVKTLALFILVSFILLSFLFTSDIGNLRNVASQKVAAFSFWRADTIIKKRISNHRFFTETTIIIISLMLSHLVFHPLGNKISKLPLVISERSQTNI
ncbi:MAG: hypothetical protein ACMG51_02000 [Ginsengibacter sp.]